MREDGLRPRSEPPKNLKKMSAEEAAEAIRDWFFENYEDPVHSTPYVGNEGGYQYIHGGPYDARDVLEDEFSGVVRQRVIDAAVELIEEDGTLDWMPTMDRVADHEDPEDAQLAFFHRRMVQKLAEVDAGLAAIEHRFGGIGQ